jgi:hypothetical protein
MSNEMLTEIEKQIVAKGEEIRILKTQKVDKAQLTPHINDLLALKEQYQAANNGIPYAPPAAAPTEKKKETKSTEPPQPPRDGPSKKELNRQKKKEQKETGVVKDFKPESKVAAAAAPVATPSTSSAPQLFFHPSNVPQVSNSILALCGLKIQLTASSTPDSHQPYLYSPQQGSISGDYSIARYLARQFSPNLISSDSWLSSQIDQWIDHCVAVNTMSSPVVLTETLPLLESHLKDKTFLVGSSVTLADFAVLDLLQRGSFAPSSTFPAVDRWIALISSAVPSSNSAELKAKAGKAAKAAKAKPKKENTENDDTCPELEGAVEGQVVTRFPPEPSGYLHIGHTKAALLNQYYAQRYKGKLIIRFDDTNPSKEKEEYEQNIIRDLATLQIHGDIVSILSIPERDGWVMISMRTNRVGTTDRSERNAAELLVIVDQLRYHPSIPLPSSLLIFLLIISLFLR